MPWTRVPTHGTSPSPMHEHCRTQCSRHGRDALRMYKLHKRHFWYAQRPTHWLSLESTQPRARARRLRKECSLRATPTKCKCKICWVLERLNCKRPSFYLYFYFPFTFPHSLDLNYVMLEFILISPYPKLACKRWSWLNLWRVVPFGSSFCFVLLLISKGMLVVTSELRTCVTLSSTPFSLWSFSYCAVFLDNLYLDTRG